MTLQDSAARGAGPFGPVVPHVPKPWAARVAAQVRFGMLVLALAILAGVAAWLAGEYTMSMFQASKKASENFRDPTALNLEMPRVGALNGALTFGAFGGLLGLALGIAGGLSRRSPNRALVAAIVGLYLGAALGAVPSLVVMPWQWHHRNDDPSTTQLIMPMLVHLGLWSGIGLGAGLAFGVGTSGFKPSRLFRAALAGLTGAILGTVVYEMVGAFVFPLDHTADPFSATLSSRLLARLCIAGFVGLGVARSFHSEPTAVNRDKASHL
jgi:hypothetical protein